MIASYGSSNSAVLQKSTKHQYVLMFRANQLDLAKRVELWADDPNLSVELALGDQSERMVDVWEDGGFLCRISRTEEVSAVDEGSQHAE